MLVVTVLSLGLALPRAPRATMSVVSADLFATDAWKTLQLELDTIPVFTIGNEVGISITELFTCYGISPKWQAGGQAATPFFADVVEAENELKALRLANPELGDDVDITPAGLGSAFVAHLQGAGMLIPSTADMNAASVDAVETILPMYACMELASDRLDGVSCIPLFVALADAQAAVAQATAEMAPEKPLQINLVSLERAVEQMCTADDAPTFRFVASSASVNAIRAATGV